MNEKIIVSGKISLTVEGIGSYVHEYYEPNFVYIVEKLHGYTWDENDIMQSIETYVLDYSETFSGVYVIIDDDGDIYTKKLELTREYPSEFFMVAGLG